MNRLFRSLLLVGLILLLVAVAFKVLARDHVSIDDYSILDKAPRIRPDYTSSVVPVNIAPLNFIINEPGSHYFVRIHSEFGSPIEIFSREPEIIIPQKPWHKLLENNPGGELFFDIYVMAEDGSWSRFLPVSNQIASDMIDRYLVYRKIQPGHGRWRQMGIYQRDLRNYTESVVLHNRSFEQDCVNCHAFRNNHTDSMTIGIRSSTYGSSVLLVRDGVVNKIGSKFGYTSWHPSGRAIAYSINNVRQFFHAKGSEVRDVVDLDSLLAYYLVDQKKIKTVPQISKKERLETYPAWSPDGKFLYFSSAPILWTDRKKSPPDRFDEVKYDIVRVSYDIDTDKWGKLETVVSADDTSLSSLEPRISPDGRWLVFVMCDYGCFPVYRQSSDLYIIDLEAAERSGKFEYRRLEINSDKSESWHSFSSNSRWIVFSSKRDYGVFTRSYISHLDESGQVSKPLILPQKDPAFYDSYTKTFSVPELVVEPVKITGEKLGRVVRGSGKISVEMPITLATPKAGAFPTHQEPWLGGRE